MDLTAPPEGVRCKLQVVQTYLYVCVDTHCSSEAERNKTKKGRASRRKGKEGILGCGSMFELSLFFPSLPSLPPFLCFLCFPFDPWLFA